MSKRIYRAWLPNEIEFLRANYRDLGVTLTASALGRTRHSTHSKAAELGVTTRWLWTAAQIAFIKAHYPTLGPQGVAKALEVGARAVRAKAHKLGVRCIPRHKPKPCARTKAIVARIALEIGRAPREIFGRNREALLVSARWRVSRELRDLGYSFPRIGIQLGRNHTTIMQGLRRLAEAA